MAKTHISRGDDRYLFAVSEEINIDNGSGTTADYLLLVTDKPIYIESARVIYTEATDTAGAASATVSLGIAAGGVTIVAASALAVSKAVGSYTDLTLASHVVPANSMLIARHTGIATTEAGKYKVQVRYRFVD